MSKSITQKHGRSQGLFTTWEGNKLQAIKSQEFLKLAPSRIYIEKIHRHNCRHHKWVTWHPWHYDKTQTKTHDCLVNLTNTLYCGHLCLAKFHCNARVSIVFQPCKECSLRASLGGKQSLWFHNVLQLLFTILTGIPTWQIKCKNWDRSWRLMKPRNAPHTAHTVTYFLKIYRFFLVLT